MIRFDLQRLGAARAFGITKPVHIRMWLVTSILVSTAVLSSHPAGAAEPLKPWHVLLIFDGSKGLPRVERLEDESRRLLQIQSNYIMLGEVPP